MAGAVAPLTAPAQRDKSVTWRNPAHLMEGLSLPATPSKSKLPGKPRFCTLTTLLVLFAMVAGVAIFNQELGAGGGASRTETYYRKALVAKMVFSEDGKTVTATREEYSRSTVKEAASATQRAKAAAAADKRAAAANDAAAAEGNFGGEQDVVEMPDASAASSSTADATMQPDDGEGGAEGEEEQQDAQEQQQQVVTTVTAVTTTISSSSSATTAAAAQQYAAETAAAATAATKAAATQEQAAGQEGEVAKSEQAAATLQQQAQPQQPPPEPKPEAVDPADVAGWWSPLVSESGQTVPKAAMKERDISASLATAVLFDENAVDDLEDCKIAVLDVDQQWGATWGAGKCDLSDPRTWPFAAPGKGIDGHEQLTAEQYQYSMEHWIAQSIRNSSRFTSDVDTADFIFVDMHCYHTAWMAWLHPLNEEGRRLNPSPEYYIKRALTKMQGMRRFRETKGGSFGLVHPAPLMKGLFSEESACEDLASVLNMVPERSLLCVWTQDSHASGKSLLLPYAAVSDVDVSAPVVLAADRETLVFFQGGCGNPDPSVRHAFAAGKMLRYAMVEELRALQQPDIHAECTCDICEGHMPHDRLLASMSRSVFCPILPSNTQSSRRLSEAMLTGCIPVFVGEPFHTLPLATDVPYASFALFVNVSDSSSWVNTSSPKWEHNHMISKAWKLDDLSVRSSVVTIPRLADLVRLLRSMPADEVAARQAGVIAHRLKFYYPAATAEALASAATAGGDASLGLGLAPGAATATGGSLLGHGQRRHHRQMLAGQGTAAAAAARQGQLQQAQAGASVLGELLMRKMCHRAAAVKKRMADSVEQGMDLGDSDEKVEHPSLAGQVQAEAEAQAVLAAAAAAVAEAEAGKPARRQRHSLL